jgi:hypothetical protein
MSINKLLTEYILYEPYLIYNNFYKSRKDIIDKHNIIKNEIINILGNNDEYNEYSNILYEILEEKITNCRNKYKLIEKINKYT